MKKIPLHNRPDKFILVDDEDFDVVSAHRWFFYDYDRRHKNRGKGGVIKAYGADKQYVYLTALLFSEQHHITYVLKFKDGNHLNWQRENLLLFTNVNSDVAIQTVKCIKVDHCPFGPAHLEPAPTERSEECQRCDDTFNGPYFQCLSQASKTYWRGWRRISDDARRVPSNNEPTPGGSFSDPLEEATRICSGRGSTDPISEGQLDPRNESAQGSGRDDE